MLVQVNDKLYVNPIHVASVRRFQYDLSNPESHAVSICYEGAHNVAIERVTGDKAEAEFRRIVKLLNGGN